jgi:DNA-binding transcriptional ArsR family regulator
MTVMEASAPPVDAYEAIFTALAHPARRRILISLNFAGGAMSAGAIAGLFGHAWPTTTRHLQQLEAAGILRHERSGRSRIYRLDTGRLALVSDWLAWFELDPVTAKEKERDEQPDDAATLPAQHRGRRH